MSFSRFVYLDTNIYSYLAKNIHHWKRLSDFLTANDLCLALSHAHQAELAEAKTLHDKLVDLLLLMPSAAIKPWDVVLKEEVKAHPQCRTDSLLLYPFNQLLLEKNGNHTILSWFTSDNLTRARKDQLTGAQQMQARHSALKNNFPPSKSGKYIREQAPEFADYIIMQWLADTHPDFLASFKDRVQHLRTECFLSVRIHPLVIFYKYYLQGREPDQLSDFGDLYHLSYLPYCNLVIIERDLCNVLNQIKQDHNVLDSTVVRNIDFFKDWA